MMRRGHDLLLGLFIAGLFLSIVATQIVAGLYLLLLLGLAVARRGHRLTSADGLVILYALLALVRFDPAYAKHLILPLVLLAFVPVGWGLRERARPGLGIWLRLIVALGVVIALVGIRDHVRGAERADGLFGGWFTLAALMTWGLPPAVALATESRGPGRIAYAGAALLQAAALWWTSTRSALLGVVLAFGAWGTARLVVMGRRRSTRRRALALGAAAAAPLLILAVAVLRSDDPRLNPLSVITATGEQREYVTSGRSDIVAQARDIVVREWREHQVVPIAVGHGLASRQRLVGGKFTSWESDYLQAYMDHGLVGLLAVAGLSLAFLRLCLRALADPRRRVGALGAAGLIALVMSPLTLKLTGWHGAGVFVVNYNLLRRSLAGSAPDGAERSTETPS